MELQRDTAYAELQNATGRLFVSSGADPLPETVTATDLPTLAAEIARMLKAWEQGHPAVTGEAQAPVAMEASPPVAPVEDVREAPPPAPASPEKREPLRPSRPAAVAAVHVHLASSPTVASAEEDWVYSVNQHPDILARVEHSIVRVDLGAKGIWYRLLAGPFPDAAVARGICDTLVRRNVDCRIIGPKPSSSTVFTDTR